MRDAHRGFTLIEMIVALVLASIMMVGLLRIVSVVSLESNQLRGEQTDYVAAGFLADRLREDLINARGIVASAGSMTLSGYMTAQRIEGMVRYEQTTVGQASVLVRRSGDRSEVCWIGFGRFVYESYDELDNETPVPESTGGLPAMPSRFRIAVLDVAGRVLLNEVVVHHAE